MEIHKSGINDCRAGVQLSEEAVKWARTKLWVDAHFMGVAGVDQADATTGLQLAGPSASDETQHQRGGSSRMVVFRDGG